MNSNFSNIPDISFIDNLTLADLQENIVNWYQDAYEEITGESVELGKANPYRLMLYSCALAIYQGYQFVDSAGKKNLLKYSYGDYLDNLGVLRGVTRTAGNKATATFRFSLASAMGTVVSIPKGTRMSINNIFFATTAYAEIAMGSTYVDVLGECTEIGTAANGFVAGSITTIVDPVPYVDHAANTTVTANGTDIEDDDSFALRISLAGNAFSVAGPTKAYEYFVRSVSSEIEDVYVSTPSAGTVDVKFVLEGGTLPGSTLISTVSAYLNSSERRPLTDTVTVGAPTTDSYNINMTYYINSSDSSNAASIQTAVTAAVNEYKTWQDSKISRDIIPDELIHRVMEAGAKRVTITAPTFTTVSAGHIAKCGTVTVTYGGLEND